MQFFNHSLPIPGPLTNPVLRMVCSVYEFPCAAARWPQVYPTVQCVHVRHKPWLQSAGFDLPHCIPRLSFCNSLTPLDISACAKKLQHLKGVHSLNHSPCLLRKVCLQWPSSGIKEIAIPLCICCTSQSCLTKFFCHFSPMMTSHMQTFPMHFAIVG